MQPRDAEDVFLTEVSLVDDPANPEARVALAKRKDQNMDEIEAMTLKVAELEEANAALAKSVSEAEAELSATAARLDSLTKAVKEMDLEVSEEEGEDEEGGKKPAFKIEKRAEPEMIEVDGEMLVKSAIPAVILRKLEAQAEDLEKARAEAAAEDMRKQADAMLPNLKGTADERAALLKAVGDDAGLLAILRAADAAMAALTGESGETVSIDKMVDPASALDTLAKARAEETGKTYQVAYAEVVKTDEGKELAKRLYAKA